MWLSYTVSFHLKSKRTLKSLAMHIKVMLRLSRGLTLLLVLSDGLGEEKTGIRNSIDHFQGRSSSMKDVSRQPKDEGLLR